MPKGLFIGLGGTGVTTLTKLKAKLFHDFYKQNMDLMSNECKFIFYDTDPASKSMAIADPEIGRMMGSDHYVIDEDEYISAATVKPYSRYMGAKTASASDLVSQRMLEWMIDPDGEGHLKIDDKELGQGAGANRMKGRVGIMDRFEVFERKITDRLKQLRELENQGANQEAQRPHIWVFASSNGGTSSSALLDVLYLANRVYRENYQANPYLRLVLFMPKPFMDVNKNSLTGYTLNGYSTLWELNAFRYDRVKVLDGGKKFGTFAVRPDNKTSWKENPWPVCSYVMAVDIESKAGKLNNIEQMIDNTANLCYFIHSGSLGESMVSKLDNDFDEDKTFYKEFKKPQNEKFGWAYFVVGSGYKTLTKADDYLRDYIRKRFRYDLFGYGLLGLDFEKIISDKDKQKEAVIQFAKDYILKHLINIDKHDLSSEETLYGRYKKEFLNAVKITISEGETVSKEDWNNAGDTFIKKCTTTRLKLDQQFVESQKEKILDAIKDSVCEGIDDCVVGYGVNYAYSLLNMVDDSYLQTEVQDMLSKIPNIAKLETAITDASAKNRRKQENVTELIDSMKAYLNACIEKISLEHISKIISAITEGETALLEYIRKGDGNHKGLLGLQRAFGQTFVDCSNEFDRLASAFKDTKREPCTEYFPRVRDMVDDKSAWKPKNEFEKLYASLVPLDDADNALTKADKNHGRPPKRGKSIVGGLAHSIELVKKDESHKTLIADMALSDDVSFRELRGRLEKHIDDYIQELLTKPSDVRTWLGYSLEQVFDAQFTKEDGTKDSEAQRKYISEFNANIPVFYPTRSNMTSEVLPAEKYLYVGATEDFAKKMGYSDGDQKQYLEDDTLRNRLLVCKLEVGHNFYDYMYFDDLKDVYEENAENVIMKLGSGCHIHKAFVTRDIAKAYEVRKAKKFDDFIKLCWFDSYFELLNKYPSTKDITDAIFGEASASLLDEPDSGSSSSGGGKKSTGKVMDDVDLLDEESSLGDDLDEEIEDIVTEAEDTDIEDLSVGSDDMDDETGMEDDSIEEGLTKGYSPIVTISTDLSVVIKSLKKSEMAGVLAFVDGEDTEADISGATLLQIRKKIINNLENVDFARNYFANFSEMFGSFPDETKKKLINIHRVHKDKVKALFLRKINPILKRSKHKTDVKDLKVRKLLDRCVQNLIGKDIFK